MRSPFDETSTDKLSQTAKNACTEMEEAKNALVPSICIWEIARQRGLARQSVVVMQLVCAEVHAGKPFVSVEGTVEGGGFPQ